MLYLAIHGFDRAIMLIPTWLILLFWVAAASLAVTGRSTNDLVQPALVGGLVLIVMLIAFTIMQHAFAGGALAQGLISDAEQKALALVGAGHSVWDWDTARDRIETGRDIEQRSASSAARSTARRATGSASSIRASATASAPSLDAVVKQRRGRHQQDFRMRAEDGHFLWFRLKARPVIGSDGEVMRCVGTLVRHHGREDRRGAAAARRGARQPDRPAEPAALLDRLEVALTLASQDDRCADGPRGRHRQVQDDQRRVRLLRRATPFCWRCRAA